jgi:hypothetical protein
MSASLISVRMNLCTAKHAWPSCYTYGVVASQITTPITGHYSCLSSDSIVIMAFKAPVTAHLAGADCAYL